jgi:N-methylhydantoinase B
MATATAEEFIATRASMGGGSALADADPITTEVIRHGLNSAAEQMKIALRRTAFSPVIYEMIDFCCARYDRDVRLLAQAQALPAFLGTMNFCVESCVRSVGGEEELEEGDIIFSTYGFDIGSHSQDAAVVAPVFIDGELVGYAAIKAHHMDIGAKEPYCTDTTDNFQEGTIFPGVKLYRRGELQKDMYRTIVANSRLPVSLQGDLNAEILALKMGNAALLRLIERHGIDTFRTSVERMFDHGEMVMRSYLERIPDGRYVERGAMDSNGVTDELVPFEVAVEVEGSNIVIDFTASPPEQRGPVNCPLPTTVSCARLAILSVTGGNELVNEGHLRPIEIRTKPGTMYHPMPPAPIFLYGWAGMQALDVILRALASAMPESVPAGSGGDLCAILWWGRTPDGGFWVNGNDHFAGQGALSTHDGPPPMMHIAISGIRNTPAESLEARNPVLVRRFELATDSGGPGRSRGGLGLEVEYELCEDSFCTSTVERTRTAPWGLAGGGEGTTNIVRTILPDGSAHEFGKVTGLPLPSGTRVQVRTGGGGGFGNPVERDPDAVWEDIRQEYVSESAARRHYPHAFAGSDEQREHDGQEEQKKKGGPGTTD